MPDPVSILTMAKSDEVPTLATAKPSLVFIMLARLEQIASQWNLEVSYLNSNVPNKEFCRVSNVVISVRKVRANYVNGRGETNSSFVYECEIYWTNHDESQVDSELIGTLDILTLGTIIFAIKRNATTYRKFEYFAVENALYAEDWIRTND